MRRLFAITMLVAYLFNLAGYNAFFAYSISQANERVIQQLDKQQYNEDQLIEIKIKLNLPYMSDWSDYERYDGEVELQGVHYNYVKRKISQDTLYMLCVPNQSKTELYKEKNNYLVNVNDISSGKEDRASMAKKIVSLDEFKQQLPQFDFALMVIQGRMTGSAISFEILRFYISTPGKPPEIIC